MSPAGARGHARDALGFAQKQVTIELNASQENPILVPDEDRIHLARAALASLGSRSPRW